MKLHGALFGIGEILEVVRACPGVHDAQLVLTPAPGSTRTAGALTVHFTGAAAAAGVRDRLLRQVYDLGVLAAQRPHLVGVERVDRLGRVERTNKIPPMLWRTPEPA